MSELESGGTKTPIHAKAEGPEPNLWPPPAPVNYSYAGAQTGGPGSTNVRFLWTPKKGYIIEQDSSLRTKTVGQFPLSQEGWTEAWTLIRTEYPALAEEIRHKWELHFASREVAERDAEARAELERLNPFTTLTECTLLGGYGYGSRLIPGRACTLHFTDEGLWVTTGNRWSPEIRSPYSDALSLEISGPGAVRKGGGFIGGGFGAVGAVEGMIVASVLNALTSRTTIHTIVRYEATDLEAFFFYSQAVPDKLRIQLSRAVSLVSRHRERTPEPAPGKDPIADLERLSRLHADGTLSDQEFVLLKSKVIAQIADGAK